MNDFNKFFRSLKCFYDIPTVVTNSLGINIDTNGWVYDSHVNLHNYQY